MSLEKRLLVYLGASGAVAMLMGRFAPKWKTGFPGTAEGLRQFSDLLDRHRHVPVTLLVDSVDEDYRLENMPHVFGRARQELLSRRLKQVFRNAPYASAILQGRNKDGRRDDRYLLVSLTDNDWLQPWIDTLRALEIPFTGMTLLSVAAEHLLARLKIRDNCVLLVSRQSAGLRLTYLLQGKLRFSRLIRNDNQDHASLNVAEEVSKTQLYLTSQRLLPREGKLTVCLIDFAGRLSSAQITLNADPQFDAMLLQPAELGRRLGIPRKLLDDSPEMLYLAALEKRFPNLAPQVYSDSYLLHRIKWGFLAAGATALVASSAMAGLNWWQASSDADEMQQLERLIRQNEALYQETLRHLPQIPLSADSLSGVVAVLRKIEAANTSPQQAYERLSRVIDRHPSIVVDKLAWQAPDPIASTGSPAETIELDGRILPFDGNYRAAMDKINRFMADLKSSEGMREIKLLSEPVRTDSRTTLSGTTLDNAQTSEARFSLGMKLEMGRP
ncbi:MAG: monoheme cytochrome SoxX [Hydrogenophilaceae bacterium]|nr:monoheme cytochrome SoxX [Hydrogenophilaceae bacterium]